MAAGQSIADSPLIDEWDYVRNGAKDPARYLTGSSVKHWWIGRVCGHSWETQAAYRLSGSGCPYCAHRRVLPGFNDFATRHPVLAREFSPENGVSPSSFILSESRQFLWLCPAGHSYRKTTKNRLRGQGCPYCKGRQILPGFNDIETLFPELAREWDSRRNALPASEVSPYQFTAYYWLCSACGESWKTSPINRSLRGTGCSKCPHRFSSQEKSLVAFVRAHYRGPLVENDRSTLGGRELDILLPELSLAFEYNGEHWHDRPQWERDLAEGTTLSREHGKTLACGKLGIALLHVWSSDWLKRPDVTRAVVVAHLKGAGA